MTIAVYRFCAELHIPVALPLAEELLGVTRQAVGGDGVQVDVVLAAASAATVMDVSFCLELPFDAEYLQANWGSGDGSGVFIPGTNGWIGAGTIFDVCRPLVVRLAVAAFCPGFLSAFDRTDPDVLIRNARVVVAGTTVPLVPRWFSSERFPNPLPLSAEALDQALLRNSDDVDHFIGAADGAETRNDQYGAVALLTTSLEVAAYCYLRPRIPGGPHFNPRTYLGTSYQAVHQGTPFSSSSEGDYIACEELWGTRHEVVHNGNLQIRTWDSSKRKVDPKQLRNMNGDWRRFRHAVVRAVDWMRRA